MSTPTPPPTKVLLLAGSGRSGSTVLANVLGSLDGVFCGGALERFHDAPIDGVVVTDTVPINLLEKPANMTILPVAGLLAETILNVFADDSVSAIFAGENQLF